MQNRLRVRDEAESAAAFEQRPDGLDQGGEFFRGNGRDHAGIAGTAAGFIVTAFPPMSGSGEVAEDRVTGDVQPPS